MKNVFIAFLLIISTLKAMPSLNEKFRLEVGKEYISVHTYSEKFLKPLKERFGFKRNSSIFINSKPLMYHHINLNFPDNIRKLKIIAGEEHTLNFTSEVNKFNITKELNALIPLLPSTITTLELSGLHTWLPEINFENLAPFPSTIQTLTIRHPYFWKVLGINGFLSKNPNLRHLFLTSCNATNWQEINNWPALETLTLSNNLITQQELEDICRKIPSLRRLKYYELPTNKLQGGAPKINKDKLKEISPQLEILEG